MHTEEWTSIIDTVLTPFLPSEPTHKLLREVSEIFLEQKEFESG